MASGACSFSFQQQQQHIPPHFFFLHPTLTGAIYQRSIYFAALFFSFFLFSGGKKTNTYS
jgi:hypothetical protein